MVYLSTTNIFKRLSNVRAGCYSQKNYVDTRQVDLAIQTNLGIFTITRQACACGALKAVGIWGKQLLRGEQL